MPGNAAPTIWAGRGHIPACGNPAGTQPGSRAAPPPLPSRTGAPAPRAPGRDVFLQTHSPGQSYINGASPAPGAPGPPAEGSAWAGAGRVLPPSPPEASRPYWPGLSLRAAGKGPGQARAPAPENPRVGRHARPGARAGARTRASTCRAGGEGGVWGGRGAGGLRAGGVAGGGRTMARGPGPGRGCAYRGGGGAGALAPRGRSEPHLLSLRRHHHRRRRAGGRSGGGDSGDAAAARRAQAAEAAARAGGRAGSGAGGGGDGAPRRRPHNLPSSFTKN